MIFNATSWNKYSAHLQNKHWTQCRNTSHDFSFHLNHKFIYIFSSWLFKHHKICTQIQSTCLTNVNTMYQYKTDSFHQSHDFCILRISYSNHNHRVIIKSIFYVDLNNEATLNQSSLIQNQAFINLFSKIFNHMKKIYHLSSYKKSSEHTETTKSVFQARKLANFGL